MKTGIKLIAQERKEQIEVHGYDVSNDLDYGNGELVKAALFSINPDVFEAPINWDDWFRENLLSKRNDRVECLKIAGAFIAAEIDRILLTKENNNEHHN